MEASCSWENQSNCCLGRTIHLVPYKMSQFPAFLVLAVVLVVGIIVIIAIVPIIIMIIIIFNILLKVLLSILLTILVFKIPRHLSTL